MIHNEHVSAICCRSEVAGDVMQKLSMTTLCYILELLALVVSEILVKKSIRDDGGANGGDIDDKFRFKMLSNVYCCGTNDT